MALARQGEVAEARTWLAAARKSRAGLTVDGVWNRLEADMLLSEAAATVDATGKPPDSFPPR